MQQSRLSGYDEQELHWYFTQYEHEIRAAGGLRSSAGAMQDYLELGARIQTSNGGCVSANDALFGIAARAKRVERALSRMPRDAVRVIKRIALAVAPDEVTVAARRIICTEAAALPRREIAAALNAHEDGRVSPAIIAARKARELHNWAVHEWHQAKSRRMLRGTS